MKTEYVESCCCGASFRVTGSGVLKLDQRSVNGWRNDHRMCSILKARRERATSSGAPVGSPKEPTP